jgi:hypothetical protein
MPPKRTIDSFFKKIDRDGDEHGQEQNNSPIVAEEQRSAEAPNPEEQRTAEEAPRQPAPKVQRVNAQIADTLF